MHLRIGIFSFAALLFYGCSEKETEAKQIVRPVKYALVEQAGGLQQKTFSGTTQSASKANLSFRSNGLLVVQNAKVGQRVKKGELLARLDQKDVKLAYDQAAADVQNAKAQYEAASSALARTKQLYETNNASLNDYEMAKSSYSSAETAYEISKNRLDLQASQISYTEIVAPMDGIVSAVNANINEVVSPGSPIIVMSREGDNDMEVIVGLPERYITDVSSGEDVRISVSSVEELCDGIITEVGYASSNAAGTYPVVVSMELSENAAIRPDMPAEVTFSFGSNDDSLKLIVPVKAVSNGTDGSYVYALEKAKGETYKVRKKAVELGLISERGYEIKSGLKEGEIVATAGLTALYDDRLVKLINK